MDMENKFIWLWNLFVLGLIICCCNLKSTISGCLKHQRGFKESKINWLAGGWIVKWLTVKHQMTGWGLWKRKPGGEGEAEMVWLSLELRLQGRLQCSSTSDVGDSRMPSRCYRSLHLCTSCILDIYWVVMLLYPILKNEGTEACECRQCHYGWKFLSLKPEFEFEGLSQSLLQSPC